MAHFCRCSVILVFCVAVALLGCEQSSPADKMVVGRKFPDLVLTSLDQETLNLKSLRGHLVVLNLWATWCTPCRRELPSLNRLQKTLAADRVHVVLLSVDAEADIVREYLRHKGVTLPAYIDRDRDISRRILGIRRYPDTFVISSEGGLIRRFSGETDWDAPELVAALKAAAYNRDFRALQAYRAVSH